MQFGKIEYKLPADKDAPEQVRSLMLTLVGQGDENTLRDNGLAALRRKRLLRLTSEAVSQGYELSYEELSSLLLSSLATLKRDVVCIERNGSSVHLKGRRRNGKDYIRQ